MYNFKTKLEPFGRAFANCESESKIVRMAAGLLAQAKEEKIEIDPKLGFVFVRNGSAGMQNFSSVFCNNMEGLAEQYPDEAEDFLYIRDQMAPYMTHFTLFDRFTEDQCKLWHDDAMWGGTWMGHSVPQYAGIAQHGTDFYREKVAKYRSVNPGKDDFYDSISTLLDAIDIYGERFNQLACEMLKDATDPTEIRHLEAIRDTFTYAPQKPCRDYVSATIVFMLISTFDGVDSPGHFDQYMYEFWKVTDPELRQEYLENIWIYFKQTRTWNLCISGSDENWNDLTNDLTYAILDVTRKFKFNTPNLTMRCHRNTPKKLLKAAYDTIATGCGMPALYNDEAVCPALEKLGIPPCDSHRYVMNGCNQIDIQGKSHMGLEDGHVCFGKAVEYALTNGVSQRKGELVSIETGDPREFKTFDEFYDAFLKQLDYITDKSCGMSNVSQQLYADHAPNLLRSLLTEGCIEKGIDYKAGGPLYGHGQILAQAIADSADSLAMIKKYVYEEGRYTMDELLSALKNDFVGYEEMYNLFKHNELKFGNDIEYVDSIAQATVNHFNNYLMTIPTVRGGYFSGGCSPFVETPKFARAMGTMPNGKKRDEAIIADSIGASPGCDTNGPTALLNSCLRFDQTLAGSGFILNLKFDSAIFTSEKGEESFYALCDTYFKGKGQMLTFTVINPEELIEAQKDPASHRDLMVRVGGYSEYFVNLSSDLQANVIARTVLSV